MSSMSTYQIPDTNPSLIDFISLMNTEKNSVSFRRCSVGYGRVQDLADNPVAVYDIGCFDYEVYKRSCTGKQLGLFN